MKKDITTRENIDLFVHDFYKKLLKDDRVSHFFSHINTETELKKHLVTIANFWEDILLGTIKYGKNAMEPHYVLHKTIPFKKKHFDIWLAHFNNSIDTNFSGKISALAKTRALSIATIMQIKLQN